MSGLLVFLPVAVDDLTHRHALLRATWQSLELSLLASKSCLPSRIPFQFHINGVSEPRLEDAGNPAATSELALSVVRNIAAGSISTARITFDSVPGKPRAISFALGEARRLGCNLLLCVDDDVVLPTSAVGRFLEAAAARPDVKAFTAYKAPLVDRQATPFQRLYSYAFTTSFKYNIYPKRATGSFYGLNTHRFDTFPPNCNEGHILDTVAHVHTGTVVRSPFPRTRAEEVARRMRLELACRAAGYPRLHHDPEFLDDVHRRLRLPRMIDATRYRRALGLSRGIVAEAMGRLRTYYE